MSTRSARIGSGAEGSAISDARRNSVAEMRLLIPPRLRAAHDLVCDRARATNAEALLLTGSTARGSRTSISDLDYHLIGVPIPHEDLPAELDIHVVSSATLEVRLEEGDDFTQWSLRFGLVIFDHGIVRDSLRLIERLGLWPDVSRKADQATKSLKIARAMVHSGDQDAAVEQVRTALTLAARWRLLAAHRFPLSRGELPGQLGELGLVDLAAGLAATINDYPGLEELAEFVCVAQHLVEQTASSETSPSRPHAA
jgi:hypothetical protein